MKYVCMSGVFFAAMLAASAYQSPNPEGLGVAIDAVALPEKMRDNLSSALSKCCGNLDAQHGGLVERMIAVALLASPRNREAVVMDARLRKGESPIANTGFSVQKTAAGLLALGERLQNGNRDEQRLAGYFFSLASDLDPNDDKVIYAHTLYQQAHGAADWTGLHDKTAPASALPQEVVHDDPNRLVIKAGQQATSQQETSHFKRNQVKVNSLVVRDLGAMLSGDLMEIVITILPWHLPNVLHLEFSTPVGNDMSVSFDEAISLLRTRHPNLPGGKNMRVSFDDKYAPKDGGSAGLAFALAGFSLLDGIDLDPAMAVTGDVTVDWQVRKVAGIAAKIDGAEHHEKHLVIIPAENIRTIEDIILLKGSGSLMKTQIFAVENVAQAVEIARMDRTVKLQRAIDAFAQLSAALGAGNKPDALLANNAIRQIIINVASEAPEHVSATYLAKLLSKWEPTQLSLEGTLSEVSSLLWPYARILHGFTIKREFDTMDDAVLIESIIRSHRLKTCSHPQVQDLSDSLCELVTVHSEYRKETSDGLTFRMNLDKQMRAAGVQAFNPAKLRGLNSSRTDMLTEASGKRKKVLEELQRLSQNHHFIEALLR